ncbi:hypothetical protein GGR56DRAFT_37101 [Xylariaceae sp. FL0804]|nr:hypothetical protein GGR56DRAFT_37101 [Xylariaceae sp. FL0804]
MQENDRLGRRRKCFNLSATEREKEEQPNHGSPLGGVRHLISVLNGVPRQAKILPASPPENLSATFDHDRPWNLSSGEVWKCIARCNDYISAFPQARCGLRRPIMARRRARRHASTTDGRLSFSASDGDGPGSWFWGSKVDGQLMTTRLSQSSRPLMYPPWPWILMSTRGDSGLQTCVLTETQGAEPKMWYRPGRAMNSCLLDASQ